MMIRSGPIRFATAAMARPSAWAARVNTARTAASPPRARRTASVMVSCASPEACRACSTIACVAATDSTQPMLPQVHIRSAPRTGRCPTSPATPWAPVTTWPSIDRPAPIPVPTVMTAKDERPGAGAGPLLGHGQCPDIVLDDRGQPGGLLDQLGQRHALPVEERGAVHHPRAPVDVTRDRHAQAVYLRAARRRAARGLAACQPAHQPADGAHYAADVLGVEFGAAGGERTRRQIRAHAEQLLGGHLHSEEPGALCAHRDRSRSPARSGGAARRTGARSPRSSRPRAAASPPW